MRYNELCFFSIYDWTKFRKTYQIDAVLIDAATIQEQPLMARVRYFVITVPKETLH